MPSFLRRAATPPRWRASQRERPTSPKPPKATPATNTETSHAPPVEEPRNERRRPQTPSSFRNGETNTRPSNPRRGSGETTRSNRATTPGAHVRREGSIRERPPATPGKHVRLCETPIDDAPPNRRAGTPGSSSGRANSPCPPSILRKSEDRAPTPGLYRSSGDTTPSGYPPTPSEPSDPPLSSTYDTSRPDSGNSARGRPSERQPTMVKKISAVFRKRRSAGSLNNEPGLLDKVKGYGSALRERTRSRTRMRQDSAASHRQPGAGSRQTQESSSPPMHLELLPARAPPVGNLLLADDPLEEAITRIAGLEAAEREYLATLAHAEEQLAEVEDERDALRDEVNTLRAEVARLRGVEDEVKELEVRADRMQATALAAQKEAVKAREDARHADAARESEGKLNAQTVARLEGERDDVRERWKFLKEHCNFREAFSGFEGQQLHDYEAWQRFWGRSQTSEDESCSEGFKAAGAAFETWLRFNEDTEDALRDKVDEQRARWDAEVADERTSFAAQRERWSADQAGMLATVAGLRVEVAEGQMAALDQEDRNRRMEQRVDKLIKDFRAAEEEKSFLYSDIADAQDVETRLRARIASRDKKISELGAHVASRDKNLCELNAREETMRTELEAEKRKHAEYRRVAAGYRREGEALREEIARMMAEKQREVAGPEAVREDGDESEDDVFVDSQEEIDLLAL